MERARWVDVCFGFSSVVPIERRELLRDRGLETREAGLVMLDGQGTSRSTILSVLLQKRTQHCDHIALIWCVHV